MTSSDKAEWLLKRYQREVPKFTLRVRCWHTETSGSGDDKKTKTVTTYDVRERVHVLSCVDVTENLDDVNLKEYSLTKIKLTKSFVADRNFANLKAKLYQENKHRDRHCAVTEQMEISSFEPYILAFVEGHEQTAEDSWTRLWLNPAVYAAAHVLLYPALPYRIWLCSITGKIKLDIRKKIETADM